MKLFITNGFDIDTMREANPHLIIRMLPGAIAVFPRSRAYGDTRPHGNAGKCKMCGTSGPGCPAQSPGVGYSCTRPEGHKGDHVACSIDTHKLAVWA